MKPKKQTKIIKKKTKQTTSKINNTVDWNEVGNSYEPINFNEENQLKQSLNEIIEDLQSKDWETQKNSIFKLQGITNGNATTLYLQTFMESLNIMKTTFCDLIESERSALFKHTCYLIVNISRKIEAGFSAIFEWIFNTLLKRTISSIQRIADSAHQSIVQLLVHSPTTKIFSFLNQALSSSKSGQQRAFLSLYNKLCIKFIRKKELSSNIDIIEKNILISLHDAKEITRSEGKESYWEYFKRFPERAKFIYLKEDKKTQMSIISYKHPANNLDNKNFLMIEDEFSPPKPKIQARYSSKKISPLSITNQKSKSNQKSNPK
eukprot:Anaeramoba_ignava/a483344_23.p1 GENE.a483344_23~~a483344_23.p1  ORF type:complete len:320 (-),score=111.98 a483344_23:18-977(-)